MAGHFANEKLFSGASPEELSSSTGIKLYLKKNTTQELLYNDEMKSVSQSCFVTEILS